MIPNSKANDFNFQVCICTIMFIYCTSEDFYFQVVSTFVSRE